MALTDGTPEEFQIPTQLPTMDANPLVELEKYIKSLESTVHQKEEHIKRLNDQLKNRGDVRLLEFRRAFEKLFDEYFPNETMSSTHAAHFSQTSVPIEASQLFSGTAEEEYQASSSTSVNHTLNHSNHNLNLTSHIHNHANHESVDSEYSRPNEFRPHGYEPSGDNSGLRYSNENKSMIIMPPLPSSQRRFVQNGMNGTSSSNNNNHNYHNNNNNNNNRNNNNNNNNNRKNSKYTVFVSWSGKMERSDLDELFDRNDVAEIRHSPNKQFAHFDFKTFDAMNKAFKFDKKIINQEHGQLRVEAGRPRSNNTDNNNNNNGQRQQNKNYNNRPQNKQNGIMNNGYNQQKTYKYVPNGIGTNGILGNHPNISDDLNDTPISTQSMVINSVPNHSDL